MLGHRDSLATTVFDVGYRIEALELPLRPPDGRKVVVDVLYWRADRSRALAAEAKSGANIADDQAVAYRDLAATSVVQAASISITTPTRPQLQTVFACLEEHQQRIGLGLRMAGLGVPILSIGEDEVVAHGQPFDDSDLRELFQRPLRVSGPAPALLTIDDQSPADEFDRVLAPTIVACLAMAREDATIDYLAEESLPFFSSYGRPHRGVVRAKILDAARRAADAAPETLAFQPETNQRPARLRFLRSPEQADPRGRTQAYQSLAGRLGGIRATGRLPGEDQGVFEIFGASEAGFELELNEGATDADELNDDREE